MFELYRSLDMHSGKEHSVPVIIVDDDDDDDEEEDDGLVFKFPLKPSGKLSLRQLQKCI